MLEKIIKEFYGKFTVTKATVVTFLFLLIKLSFPYNTGFVYLFVNEFLVIHAYYFWINVVLNKIILSKKNILPLLNSLLIVLFMLLLLIVGTSAFIPEKIFFRLGFTQRFILLTIATVIYGLILYAFTILVKFFFYRQKGNPKGYYRAMLLLSLLAGVLESVRPFWNTTFDFKELFPSIFSWVDNFTSIVEISLILLIIGNSFRVAWIAKLTKKEKYGLIIRSFIISTLFVLILSIVHYLSFSGLNIFATGGTSNFKKIAYLYSPFLFKVTSFVLIYGTVNSAIIFFTTIFHLPTAEESDKKSEELSMLWDFGKLLNQIFDINELSESIISLAKQVSNSEKAWIKLTLNGREIFVHNKINKLAANEISHAIYSYKNIEETKVVVLSEHPQINYLQKFDVDKILLTPLKINNKNIGYIFTARDFNEESYDDDEINALSGLSDYASLAISKAELVKASIEKERMEKELEVAREIQRNIIPTKLPEISGFDISAKFIPAFEVGGDYFDFFKLNGKYAFVLADVSGKGIEASYIMAEMKGIFEALSVTEQEIYKLIIKANEILNRRLKRENFVTAIVGIIEEGKISYYRIGHNKPIRITNNSSEFIESKGLAFGLTQGSSFAENLEKVSVDLNSGDAIVFYTDGINEAHNEVLSEYGYERFFKSLTDNKDKNAELMAIKVIEGVSLFASNNFQNDDITILVFKKN